METLMLTGSTNSRLVDLSEYNSTAAHVKFLQFRLEVLVRILSNRQVLMPEGWALDSLVFLRVANEVIDATTRLRKRADAPTGIESFDPFVMEIREEGGYLDTMLRYMERSDIRWAGYAPLKNDLELKDAVARELRELKDSGKFVSGDILFRPMANALDREDVPEALSQVATYFLNRESHRVLKVDAKPNLFQGRIVHLMDFLRSETNYNESTRELGKPLLQFADQVRDNKLI